MIRLGLVLAALLMGVPRWGFAQPERPLPQTTLLDVQPGERSVPEMLKLAIYKPKHLPAQEAAAFVQDVIGKSASVAVEPSSNSLLIRASESQLNEAKSVLEALDQPPKMIAFEIVFADLPAQADDAQPEKAPNSEQAWLERLQQQAGKKANFQTVRLTATENLKAMVQYGGETPVVSGVQQGFGGGRGGAGRTPILRQTATGTIVQCTARVLQDETVIAELEIERSQIAPPEDAAVLDENDDTGTLRAPGMLTTTSKTTLRLKPGKPRLISGLKSQGAAGNTQSVILITAELVTPEQ